MQEDAPKIPPPFVVPLVPDDKKPPRITVDLDDTRYDKLTLGAAGLGARVGRLPEPPEAEAVLVLPYAPGALRGLDLLTLRVFRHEPAGQTLSPIWNSGVNTAFSFIWAKIQRSGTYVPIALPRDRVLQQALRELSYVRRTRDDSDAKAARALTLLVLEPFLRGEPEALDEIRHLVARLETATTGLPFGEMELGIGGHPEKFPLPNGMDRKAFRARLEALEVLPGGLPEEALFAPPEITPRGEVAWPARPDDELWRDLDRVVERLTLKLPLNLIEVLKWFLSKDWPMYQHDVRHTGRASGFSSLTSSTVGQLQQRFKCDLDGPVNTKPSIADGKVYVGTTKYGSNGGTLYKIDMCSGVIEGRFPTTGSAFYSISGIGGSPAVYKGKVYFATVFGQVYCVDAATMTESPPHPPALWVTDIKTPSAAKKQPVNNPDGDCWTSVLVVNDRVYVGSGEGEEPTTWGFIWCLDANNGHVEWLFCTNKRQNINAPGTENAPNAIPRSAAVSDPLPGWATAAGFTLMDDPPETGSSPWSSFGYDAALNRVYVGTGNSQYLGGLASAVLPDQRYGSGMIALDATTGKFQGFHVGAPDDSYHANDTDVDVPGSPTVFVRGGQRVVSYGSKNGSFFLLDANTMQVLGAGAQRRQLLAREGGSGHPGNRGNAIPAVATTGGFIAENKWGVMATPAIHTGLGKIFVGLGGYSGARGGTITPFIRALDWNTLDDAWPTVLAPGNVTKYSLAQPPVYNNDNEAALSSPAVVNDVVFVSTTDPANSRMRLYALDAATGLCLWASPIISGGGWPNYALGPAISGEYVVAGAGNSVYIYTRPSTPWCLRLVWPFRWDLLRRAIERP
jgi:outer membrane protein assembly factor BamB